MSGGTYNKERSKHLGPGGMDCPCCTIGTAKEHLKMETRRDRHAVKITLNKETKEMTDE